MFLRFLIADGKCAAGLEGPIPVLAHWRLSSLPRYLQSDEVELVIASCDPETPVGKRDRAILLFGVFMPLFTAHHIGLGWSLSRTRKCRPKADDQLTPSPEKRRCCLACVEAQDMNVSASFADYDCPRIVAEGAAIHGTRCVGRAVRKLMPEPRSISCVHCGYEAGPHDTWTQRCSCGVGRQPMPNPESRLQDILGRLDRVKEAYWALD
jgi:hypothetical protein